MSGDSKLPPSCGLGIIHVLESEDEEYDLLHVRVRIAGIGVPQLNHRPSYKIVDGNLIDFETLVAETDEEPFVVSSDVAYNPSAISPHEKDEHLAIDDEIASEKNDRDEVVLEANIKMQPMQGRRNESLQALFDEYACMLIHYQQRRYRCTLGAATPFETAFYVIKSASKSDRTIDGTGKIVLIVGARTETSRVVALRLHTCKGGGNPRAALWLLSIDSISKDFKPLREA